MDLSPREVTPATPKRRQRKWASIGVLVAVLVAAGIVVTKFLTSAIDYYCNVDEIGVKDGCEPGRRLRVQGTVDEGTIEQSSGMTDFTISFNGRTLPVRYQGEPGGLFRECMPVVIHGRLDSGDLTPASVFDGDRVEVKHDNKYESEHSDRIGVAKESACSPPA